MPQHQNEVGIVRHTANIGDAMVRAMVDSAAAGDLKSEVYVAGMSVGFARGTMPSAMHFWSNTDYAASGLAALRCGVTVPLDLDPAGLGDMRTAELIWNLGRAPFAAPVSSRCW